MGEKKGVKGEGEDEGEGAQGKEREKEYRKIGSVRKGRKLKMC